MIDMKRRSFLTLFAAPVMLQPSLRRSRRKNTDTQATSRYIVAQAVRRARTEGWDALPIGELMGKLGQLFIGTPYVGGTLDGDGPEICRIDVTGLDCVTYFENVLGMARVIKKRKSSFEDLQKEITFTRYRQGMLNGYASRLHYTAEWIEDNVKKGVVTDITNTLHADPFPVQVSFMSENPRFYRPLREDPTMVERMASIERSINATSRWYVPKDRIADIEQQLQTGDIIAITTSKAGLDYAHTGLVFVTDDGVRHLMHASSQQKKVVLDVAVHAYVQGVRTHTGISVVRPTEVS